MKFTKHEYNLPAKIKEYFTHDVCPKCQSSSVPVEGVPDQSFRGCAKCLHTWSENLDTAPTVADGLVELDEFTRGYIMSALWTFDDGAPSGEFSTSGRFEILFPKISTETLAGMVKDCAEFQASNGEDLKAFCPSDSQNGHDFWLTRNGHGTGFRDREQTREKHFEEIAERLTESSKEFGNVDLYFGDDGKIYS